MRFVRFTHGGEAPRWGRLDGEQVATLDAAPWEGGQAVGSTVPLGAVALLAPVTPSKVLCVGMNYIDHRDQDPDGLIQTILTRHMHDAPPDKDPILFLKAPSAIVGPGEAIVLPPESQRVDYEAELAVVIGRKLHRAKSRSEAAAAIFGYTLANDVSARDLQERDIQWMRAKSFDTFCPMGPWVETQFDPADQPIEGLLNGRVVQSSRTRYQIADALDLLRFASAAMTLLPGDVFLTGTPAGLGPLAPGDTFAVRVPGIGELTNPVRGSAE